MYEGPLGDPERAWNLYTELVSEHPGDLPIWDDLLRVSGPALKGQVLLQIFAAATGVGETTATLEGQALPEETRLSLVTRQAQLLETTGHEEVALACYEELSESRPDDPEIWAALARLYESMQRWEPLLEVLYRQEEIETDEKASSILLSRCGHIYEDHLSVPEEALLCFERAFELDGSNGDARRSLAARYYRDERFEDLVHVLETWLESAGSTDEAGVAAVVLALVLEQNLGE